MLPVLRERPWPCSFRGSGVKVTFSDSFRSKLHPGLGLPLTTSGAVFLARLKAQVWVMGFHKKHPGRATPLSLSQLDGEVPFA